MMTAVALVRPRTEAIAACPVCCSPRAVLQVTLPDYLHGVPGTYSYVRCAYCRTVYQNPRVIEEDLGYCYPTDYFTHRLPEGATIAEDAPSRGTRDMLRRAIRHYADGASGAGLAWWARASGGALSRVPRLRMRARFGLMDTLSTRGAVGPKCLEVGPGQGQTLRHLRTIGWQAMGLDIDAAAARTAAAVSGCEVKVGTLASVDLPAFFVRLSIHEPRGRTFARLASLARARVRATRRRWPPGHALSQSRLVGRPLRSAVFLQLGCAASSCVAATRSHDRASERDRLSTRKRAHAAPGTQPATAIAPVNTGPRRLTSRLLDETTIGDRAFGCLESICVAAGASVGEEILVIAHKGDAD